MLVNLEGLEHLEILEELECLEKLAIENDETRSGDNIELERR